MSDAWSYGAAGTTVHPGYPCRYCSGGGTEVWHLGSCPRVKAIEYYADGSVKRVELRDAAAGGCESTTR